MAPYTNAHADWAEALMNQPFADIDIIENDLMADRQWGGLKSEYGEEQQQEESSESSFSYEEEDIEILYDIVPTDSVRHSDVLMGRGQFFWMRVYPGTLFFRSLVDKAYVEYDTASKSRKGEICRSIVSSIAKKRGRFLEPYKIECGNVVLWKRLNYVEARKKVAYSFRGIRKQQQRKLKRQISIPSHPTLAFIESAPRIPRELFSLDSLF